MLGRLFERTAKVTDPAALAERDRQQREAQKARREAETAMAGQRQGIEAATRIDTTPPF